MVLCNSIEREDSYVSWICNSKTRYSSPLFLYKVIYYKLKKHVVSKLNTQQTLNISPYIFEPEKSIEVYKKTSDYLLENSNIKEKIGELGWFYHIIGMTIPQN